MFGRRDSSYPPAVVTVALYGQSLALSSVGASLKPRKWLQLVVLDAKAPDVARQLAAVKADVLIFDVATAHPDSLALWKTRPDLLLVGVDLSSGVATVLSHASAHVATADELLHIIRVQSSVGSTARGQDRESLAHSEGGARHVSTNVPHSQRRGRRVRTLS